MDRTQAPAYKEIENIRFIDPQLKTLDNGLELIIFKTGSQEIVKIELVFEAGIIKQNKNLVASTTNSMLQEGSTHFSADEIAEQLDFYGSHLSLSIDKDFAKITFFSLDKHLEKGLKILIDIIQNPSFPQEKLDRYLSKSLQTFKRNQEKVKDLASRKFTQELFGKDHPYGSVAKESDFSKISRNDLISFFETYYQPQNCKMVIAGQFSNTVLEGIESSFSSWQNSGKQINPTKAFIAPQLKQHDFLIEKKEAMQSGLRLGKILFNRTHKDYAKMQVVNTLLGGYFGSRLMKNIREDKGYTYGIGSALISQKETGYLTIVSEVNATVSKETIIEIKKEIQILQTQLVSQEELSKVKSYMLGRLLRAVDGPFSLSDTYLNAYLYGMDWNYYKKYIQTIRNITSKEILDLSQRYLQENSLIKVIAGK